MSENSNIKNSKLEQTSDEAGNPEKQWKTVCNLKKGYLAIRNTPAARYENEINHIGLHNGDKVQFTGKYIQGTTFGNKPAKYAWVYAPQFECNGYVNADFIK